MLTPAVGSGKPVREGVAFYTDGISCLTNEWSLCIDSHLLTQPALLWAECMFSTGAITRYAFTRNIFILELTKKIWLIGIDVGALREVHVTGSRS